MWLLDHLDKVYWDNSTNLMTTWRITGGSSTSSNSSVGCTSFFPKFPLKFDVVPFQSLKSSGFRSIHVNPHYWKRSSSIVPSFFRPICWMATETSSDGEMQVFHMFQAKQLGGFAFALVLNAELIRFSRNNKGAKIFVEFSSIPFGDVFFSVFIWG